MTGVKPRTRWMNEEWLKIWTAQSDAAVRRSCQLMIVRWRGELGERLRGRAALRLKRLLRLAALRFERDTASVLSWKQFGASLALIAEAPEPMGRESEDGGRGKLLYQLRDTLVQTMASGQAFYIFACAGAEIEAPAQGIAPVERAADAAETALLEAWLEASRRLADEPALLRVKPEPASGDPSAGGDVEVRYSPIVSLLDGTLYGYEAIPYRKTSGERWSAEAMFAAAEAEGRLYECDRRFRELAIRGLPIRHGEAKLFLPVPASIMNDARLYPGTTLRRIEAAGLRPEHVVLKFACGAEGGERDEAALRAALRHYRVQGFRIALSGITAHRESLARMLSLHPDYAQVDVGWMLEGEPMPVEARTEPRVGAASADSAPGSGGALPQKTRRSVDEMLLGALAGLARKEQVVLLADGIVRERQLASLVSSGIGYGQGGWIAPEEPMPAPIRATVRDCIRREVNKRYRKMSGSLSELTMAVETFRKETPVSEIARLFERHRDAHGFVIADAGRPIGLIMKEKLHQMLSGQFGLPLYWNRPVEKIMDTQPMTVEESTPIDLVSQMAMAREPDKLYDAVVVTHGGIVRGIASIRSLLEWVTHARMTDAQWANPLTGLPGNEPIRRELSRRIADGRPFAVIYADLDHFKWFNDRFGFHRGDEVIRFTGETLLAAVRGFAPEDAFVGHIGGDDFIVVLDGDRAEELGLETLRLFGQGIGGYVGQDAGPVVDREGKPAEADGVSISLSLLLCGQPAGWTPDLLAERAAMLKKRAKLQRGNVMVADSLAGETPGGDKTILSVGVKSS